MLQGMCVCGGVKIKIDAMVTFSGVFHFYIKLRIIFFSMVAGKRFISIRAPSEIGKSLITLRTSFSLKYLNSILFYEKVVGW